jgi:hypothetical protein
VNLWPPSLGQNGGLTMSKAKCYRILVRGELGELLSTAFENVSIETGQTLLVTGLLDQSALHGLLDRLRDFNVELISLQEIGGAREADPRRAANG